MRCQWACLPQSLQFVALFFWPASSWPISNTGAVDVPTFFHSYYSGFDRNLCSIASECVQGHSIRIAMLNSHFQKLVACRGRTANIWDVFVECFADSLFYPPYVRMKRCSRHGLCHSRPSCTIVVRHLADRCQLVATRYDVSATFSAGGPPPLSPRFSLGLSRLTGSVVILTMNT
ncbi:hypothetical protein OBBRIDRAFT_184937 [Obba rivulosa]|uniref:Secreted protein n=1 Tax=Obba rivulosa TaxID=1052685 RepID=A0A8E2ARW2_9APHY|nr:hypothetical protein OBBRIDRAFT_184937 [Obba rivulosa]